MTGENVLHLHSLDFKISIKKINSKYEGMIKFV